MLMEWIDSALNALFEGKYPRVPRDKIVAEVEARRDQRGRAIAMRFSRGNVNIKSGAFVTRQDIDARRGGSQ